MNLALEDAGIVRAVIEVRITPERGGGFNRLAERISKFDEVESCYLMSGGYDLLVFVNGASLQKVAAFVSEKLSTLEGVLSTATHSSCAPTKNTASCSAAKLRKRNASRSRRETNTRAANNNNIAVQLNLARRAQTLLRFEHRPENMRQMQEAGHG